MKNSRLINKFLLVLSLYILIVTGSCSSNESKLCLNDARNYYKTEDYRLALESIQCSLDNDSTNIEAIYLNAKIRLKLGLYEDAIIILDKNILSSYKEDSVAFYRGKCYYNLARVEGSSKTSNLSEEEKYRLAIDNFSRAIELNPKYLEAHILKSRSFHNSKNYASALLALNVASDIFPNNSRIKFSRGVEKFYLGDLVSAYETLNNRELLIDLDSTDQATVYRFRGLVLFEMSTDSIQASINSLEKSVLLDSTNSMALMNLGFLYESIRSFTQACHIYRKAGDLGEIDAFVRIREICN